MSPASRLSTCGAVLLLVTAGQASGLPTDPAPPVARAVAPVESCQETWSQDHKRPLVREEIAGRSLAGHVLWLKLVIKHQRGEHVFPGGLELPPEAPERQLLRAAHFELPRPESEVKPRLERQEGPEGATTTVDLPLIGLPEQAGRFVLTLPPLPIAVARSSGQVQTLCTAPHLVTVEDPLASAPSSEPAPDPAPRPQRELWVAARDATLALLIALPIALLAGWLLWRFRKVLTRAKPPAPPRPPWEVALERLAHLERDNLLTRQEYEAYLDRAIDTLREYLGARYGFDGLETTTREMLRQLDQRAPDFEFVTPLRGLLQRTDLVKFARRLPTEQECLDAMAEARRIVRATTRSPSLDPRAEGAAKVGAHPGTGKETQKP